MTIPRDFAVMCKYAAVSLTRCDTTIRHVVAISGCPKTDGKLRSAYFLIFFFFRFNRIRSACSPNRDVMVNRRRFWHGRETVNSPRDAKNFRLAAARQRRRCYRHTISFSARVSARSRTRLKQYRRRCRRLLRTVRRGTSRTSWQTTDETLLKQKRSKVIRLPYANNTTRTRGDLRGATI